MTPPNRRAYFAVLVGFFAGALGLAANPLSAERIRTIEAVGTQFHVTLSDGKVLQSRDLIGAVLRLGNGVEIRIEAVEVDPEDDTGEVLLHTMSARQTDGNWKNICTRGPDGRKQGFPLAGWTLSDGRMIDATGAYEIVCTSGAQGKCVRFGYKPWKTAADGRSMRDYHTACVRMMRADYCGDGAATTREGTPIAWTDRVSLKNDQLRPGMVFEAAWSPSGAVCIARVRIPQDATLQSLVGSCLRLRDVPTGQSCTEFIAKSTPEALLFNKSYPGANEQDSDR